MARQFPRLAKANPANPAHWADIDVPADEWCSARFDEAFTRAVIGSTFRGYYIQDLADPSISAVFATVSYGTRPFATLTADPGLEEMPWVLASGLAVHYEAPVARIERDEAGAALILDNGTVVEGGPDRLGSPRACGRFARGGSVPAQSRAPIDPVAQGF